MWLKSPNLDHTQGSAKRIHGGGNQVWVSCLVVIRELYTALIKGFVLLSSLVKATVSKSWLKTIVQGFLTVGLPLLSKYPTDLLGLSCTFNAPLCLGGITDSESPLSNLGVVEFPPSS